MGDKNVNKYPRARIFYGEVRQNSSSLFRLHIPLALTRGILKSFTLLLFIMERTKAISMQVFRSSSCA